MSFCASLLTDIIILVFNKESLFQSATFDYVDCLQATTVIVKLSKSEGQTNEQLQT